MAPIGLDGMARVHLPADELELGWEGIGLDWEGWLDGYDSGVDLSARWARIKPEEMGRNGMD
jgi:hypothetical protein